MSSNLDAELNKLGFEIVDEIDKQGKQIRKNLINHIDKALGVLANDGVYAYYVFCLSKGKDDKSYKEIFIDKPVASLKPFLLSDKYGNIGNNEADYKEEKFFQKLSENLHDLLFFKDALERALIYARYHAKALGDDDE
ncbi:hypothetical protein PGH24_01330 [Thermoanaerobacterium thermosaccharolyticum]|uniref:hypothetical protein n=1 Tax=Thermoanaerobacterium thermosaccharolyticum TaxID=1517 RepID=UPI00279D3590|nr:hypothetical protein PGH24_01330 [Thermoanaerobacterium thermosaccharolyticum]